MSCDQGMAIVKFVDATNCVTIAVCVCSGDQKACENMHFHNSTKEAGP